MTGNSIQFIDCWWMNNSATALGAAIEMSQVYLESTIQAINNIWFTSTSFKNSRFLSNFFRKDTDNPSVMSGIM